VSGEVHRGLEAVDGERRTPEPSGAVRGPAPAAPSTCAMCRITEDRCSRADVRCPSCGLELCGACASSAACPRCAMPWCPSARTLEAYRAYAEAVRASWGRRAAPEVGRAFELALDAGVPLLALRRVWTRIERSLRIANLEALVEAQARGAGAAAGPATGAPTEVGR